MCAAHVHELFMKRTRHMFMKRTLPERTPAASLGTYTNSTHLRAPAGRSLRGGAGPGAASRASARSHRRLLA